MIKINVKELVKMRKEGFTGKEIAKKQKCCTASVGNILRKHSKVKLRLCKCGCKEFCSSGREWVAQHWNGKAKEIKITKKLKINTKDFRTYKKENKLMISEKWKGFKGDWTQFQTVLKNEFQQNCVQ